ncbi:hypothetical protein C8R47DRAFT_1209587 [Mycena vitilis]|nr:hypothetical protein C8R47DRAFT_1209587 [Mycena vitilis]
MTSTAQLNATTTPSSPPEELRAVIATVNALVERARALTAVVEDLQELLPHILDRIDTPLSDPIFVRVHPVCTPAQVTAQFANHPDGSRPWWVVYVGREPGLYTTYEDADVQIKRCPGQQYRRKDSKAEALAFYTRQYELKRVEKWVEAEEDE